MASYVTFSRSSTFNGTRNAWDVAGVGGFGASAFGGGPESFVNNSGSLFSLAGGPSSALTTAMGSGKVLTTNAGVSFTAGPALETFSITDGAIELGLKSSDWNAIKNLELVLTTDDLVEKVVIENFVDVRLKLGDGIKAPTGQTYEVEILNAKRGEVDASGLEGGLDLLITTSSNDNTWVNAFTVTGSDFDDTISYAAGESFTGAGALNVVGGAFVTITTDMGGDQGSFAFSLAYGYDNMATTEALIADWQADGAIIEANGRITSSRSIPASFLPEGVVGLGIRGTDDRSFEIDGPDVFSVTIGGAYEGQKASKVTIDLTVFYQNELGPNVFEGAVISLYDGETLVFSDTYQSFSGDSYGKTRPGNSQIVIDSEGAYSFDTVKISAIDDPARADPHDFLVRGLTFEGLFSSGGDTLNLGPGADIVVYDVTDADNKLDTLIGFDTVLDLLRIDTASGNGTGVTVAEIGGDTVFTFADDPGKAIIVEGVTGLVAGNDYVFF